MTPLKQAIQADRLEGLVRRTIRIREELRRNGAA